MENINSDVMTPEEIYGPEAIDREFALESLIIEPGTELWKEILSEEDPFLSPYMTRLFKLPREQKFPLILILEYSSKTPPEPDWTVCSHLYRRILNCVDASLHPGSKINGPEIFGDHMVTDKSYQLSYLVVHMVSQLQVVADDSTYEDCYLKFNQVQERIRIFGNQNASLVGLMGFLRQLRRTSSELSYMKGYRATAIANLRFVGSPFPPAEEYRYRCTRFLECEIIKMFVRYADKILEFGLDVADDSLYQSLLWKSATFTATIWDSAVNVACMVDKLFTPWKFPFLETFTANIRRDRPMFAQHYNVPHLLDRDASNDQTLSCCRTFDMDLAELRRQYPMNEWNHETYGELILLAERPLLLECYL